MSCMSSRGSLQATLATATRRYDHGRRVTPTNQGIPAGFGSFAEPEPPYLPPNWSAHTQSEGQQYYACDTSLSIVTEADLTRPSVQKELEYWIQVVNTRLLENKISLPEGCELFLDLDEDSDSCFYYLANHVTRVLFWLEESSTDVLDLMPSVSPSHLRLALEEQYWSHIEFFPSHRINRLSPRLPELINVFMHAQIDTMTSNVSTSPYNTADCKQILKVLVAMRGEKTVIDRFSICTIARLWVMIIHNQHQTHFGQDVARLSRDQRILESSTPTGRRWLYTPARNLLFKIPAYCEERLDNAFVDKIVYIHEWRNLIGDLQQEWKQYGSWALGLLLFNALLIAAPNASSMVASVSMFVCNLAVVSAVALFVKHQRLATQTACDVAMHLNNEYHDTTGFQSYAIQLSLPKALCLWAALISSSQAFFCLSAITGPHGLAIIAALVVVYWLISRIGSMMKSAFAQWRAARGDAEESMV
ncbi:hypothetical protein CERSUDRAFT_116212 [Gelatoporia subvermispora B]|uniref:WW domain-containing protein n=1 Tax=Ceriporiopsis subvermispora (strain B) TaxID=914234 RepID=M2QEJ2_CERS8|nr:hypothetical protein CERSUDRAFT_116212 [Gelatoporia subvermispora B]